MVNYNLYIGITIATVTFYDIGYSIYAIRKNIKNNNEKNTLLMLVNLATALISLELTQSALLSFTQANVDNSLYNGIIGIVVGFCSLIIGMIIYFKKNK
jgi:dihydroxyacetone kinase DhaKLM complex PTS-EIIA-like component DhaM